ncbi:tetraacyldisaccharide 4'-kinase [Maridesulfovibrio zosterae]|uniref:tetraacyldisaccharide 4'-kinase n=1 Tax=Maridesulfovibrio zosterae TaxID=82171 RepID=UPI0003F7777D|nr:tetraacyldisaccharide 4'-kinase [Maridesulfovibrio zosterae]
MLIEIQNILSPILTPLSKGYGAIMKIRADRYSEGSYELFQPQCPCISVGNIGSGGSGKTPLTGWLLRWAEGHGLRVAVLTRGYGAKPPEHPYPVLKNSPVAEAGDEPLMLAAANPEAMVVVDPVRKRSGRWVSAEFKPDFIILDDGFQHMAVQRDLDFVLMTPDDFTSGWNKVIPRGTWRESVQALHRADVFFVKSSPDDFNSMRYLVSEKLSGFGKPVFQFNLEAKGLKLLGGNDRIEFGNDSFLLFSGIGKPELLLKDATKYLGRAPAECMVFKDHHAYSWKDVELIRRKAVTVAAKKIICTPKDAIKLTNLGCEDFYVIDLEVEFKESIFFDGTEELSFNEWWTEKKLHKK